MKFIELIFVFLTVHNTINAVRVGTIYNISLTMMFTSNITMNGSTCKECLCAMLMTSGNSSFLSFNCYTKGVDRVICQLFTETNYLLSSFNQIETNFNSTFYFLQLPFINQSERLQLGNTVPINSQLTTISTVTSVRSIAAITRAGDTIVGVYNTTAGASTEGKNGMYSTGTEFPAQAIDNSTSTKYLNFGGTGGYNIVASAPGVGTGFYVTPAISNASIAIGLCFATANDAPDRDPITVTLEGSNVDALDIGSSWTLIYNGSTGISPTVDPGRMQWVPQQNFSNTIAYRSYRLLVTSQRGPEWCVQYSEAQIIGYI